MAETTLPTAEICALLKRRLREAEADTTAALEAAGDDHPVAAPARRLMAVHREIRELLLDSCEVPAPVPGSPEADPRVALEAVRIEREAHQLKPEFKDVLKALFMWKDDPVERVKSD